MEAPLLTPNSNCCTEKAKNTSSCLCKNAHFRLWRENTCLLTVFALLFGACSFLACWNLHLNNELTRIRQDVDVLLHSCDHLEDLDEIAEVVDDGKDGIEMLLGKTMNSPNDVYANVDGFLTNEVTNPQPNNREHSVVKRSADRSPTSRKLNGKGKNKRGRKKNDLNRLWKKQRKAFAIHVQAKRPSGRPGINLPGRTITGWKEPSSRFLGFDTAKLLSEGFIRVTASGFYFVYSQVIFQTTDVPHMIAEIGVNANGAITFTKCQFSQSHPNTTAGSYVACHSNGVVYLSKGDGISLIVNPQNVHVYMAPEYTYFGAFLIGL